MMVDGGLELRTRGWLTVHQGRLRALLEESTLLIS